MKVVRLELENFRRHRRTAWELPDGLTAVVGPNGAGKSSLIEALTFALYGPRAVATHKDLVRTTGAPPGDAVRVSVELELAGQAVRVVRELRGKTQTPIASIEVDGVVLVQPIAGSSEQATLWVERRLGLDREGFLHTVVARQKEVDRLGRLKPAERRAFILQLVGVDALDAAIQRAREARNQRRAMLEEARRAIEPVGAPEGRLSEAQQRRAVAIDQAAAARDAVVQSAAREAAARESLVALDARAARRTGLQAALLTAQAEARRVRDGQHDAEAAERRALAAQDRIVALAPVAQGLEALQAEAAQAQQARQALAVREQRARHLAAERSRLEQARDQLARLGDAPAVPDLPTLEAAEVAARTESIRRTGELRDVQGQVRALRERRAGLARLDGAADCPTCEQPLGAAHLAAAHEALESTFQQLAAREQALRAADAEAARAAEAARQAVVVARRTAEEAARVLAQRETQVVLLASVEGVVQRLEAELGPPITAPQLAADLEVRLAAARAARDETLRLSMVAETLPTWRQRLADLVVQADVARQQVVLAQQALDAEPDPGPQLARERAFLEAARAELASRQAAGQGALVALTHAERDVADAEASLARQRKAQARATELEAELGLWTALAGAANDGLLDRFKDHVVARIAPALQTEASRLLSEFTGGRYTELVVESDFSVYVRDEGGQFELERFSGGEQDLVHLALRLATSRLLATRANAPELRFLALDEVLGSLDGERQRTLLSGLQRLGGLYSQVLCITHNESLRDGLDHVARLELDDGVARLTNA